EDGSRPVVSVECRYLAGGVTKVLPAAAGELDAKKELQMNLCSHCTLAWMTSHWELLVVLFIALLIFGRKLPDIARSVGRSMTEFKKGINEAKEGADDLASDVKDLGDEVVKEAKDASGLDEEDVDPMK
ncbi:MAG: Sec-independent protein translocase subunit TatA/TatB, partial [Planctomycetota bacterium]